MKRHIEGYEKIVNGKRVYVTAHTAERAAKQTATGWSVDDIKGTLEDQWKQYICALPVVQTNSPVIMSQMMDAIADKVNGTESLSNACNIDPRTAAYYVDALVNFGFVYQVANTDPVEFDFTPQGAEFVKADLGERTILMAEALETNPDIIAFRNDDEAYFKGRMDWNDVTKKRRMSSLESLSNYANDLEKLESHLAKEFTGSRDAHPATRPATHINSIRQGGNSPKKTKLKMNTCQECWMQYNAGLDACPNC